MATRTTEKCRLVTRSDFDGLVCAALLKELGIASGLRLRLASLGSRESRAEYSEHLREHLRTHEGDLASEVRERIELNALRAFDSEHAGTRAVMASAPRLLDFLGPEDSEHFAEVRALLDEAGVAYEVDTTLVRGLDYYTRTVFEFTSDALGAQSGVGGGGRYDGLVEQLGGPATPGMGWAAGVERILLAGQLPAAPPAAIDLYVAFEVGVGNGPPEGGPDGSPVGAGPQVGPAAAAVAESPAPGFSARAAFGVLCAARGAGLTAQMELAGRSLKNQLGHANRLGARYVAIVGAGGTTLKDMQGAGQETIPTGTVVHTVLRGLREL